METQTTTLTGFLLARIAEDEVVARQAAGDGDGKWATGSHPSDECRIEGDGMIIYDEGGHTQAQASHIARHDPARVLAWCEARLSVIGFVYVDVESGIEQLRPGADDRALRVLAMEYAHHPDYRDEWRA